MPCCCLGKLSWKLSRWSKVACTAVEKKSKLQPNKAFVREKALGRQQTHPLIEAMNARYWTRALSLALALFYFVDDVALCMFDTHKSHKCGIAFARVVLLSP